ncbi:hypothetical protein KIN20_023752 [Parelaphostrongylus tenuis]|uniref:Uncharacterized protein n=1 Tax=Parelaphostrongylus tenuis TaxID=148309 RepID=A0AAD5QT54_PARTN|nr:hypothetical protein KIN20_023752 [Parelaphostrongylus tenuis]
MNELDSRYYAGGETSFFNIANLGAAIDSCHDIMVVNPVAKLHVKWEPTDYGWCPRPEAALVLGRSPCCHLPRPFAWCTTGSFRHVPHYNTRNSSGRLNWVQKMSLPCKTISQIRSHLRAAQEHVDGRVVQPNPLYKIIIQALREACHFQFPFERPVVRYETLQMWPEKDRPVWFSDHDDSSRLSTAVVLTVLIFAAVTPRRFEHTGSSD